MTNYLKTGEVLKRLNIEIFELFDLCKNGELQAYNIYGKRIVDPDLCEKGKKDTLDKILRLVHLEEGTNETGHVFIPGSHWGNIKKPLTREERERKARKLYNAQPDSPIVPEDCVSFNFSFPARPSEFQTLRDVQKKSKQKIKDAESFKFKKSDVEKLEIENGLDKPEKDAENIRRLSFYKNGQIWKIGEYGKEKDFTDLKGYKQIQFLLKHEEKKLSVTDVYHLGKSLPENDLDYGYTPEGINTPDISKHEVLSVKADDEDPEFITRDTEQPLIDEKAANDIKRAIDSKKEELKKTIDQQKKLEIRDEIHKLEKYRLSTKYKFKSTQKENNRTAVQKAIKRALEAIHDKLPELKEFLNNETITSGHECCYKPKPSNPVKWVLDPPV